MKINGNKFELEKPPHEANNKLVNNNKRACSVTSTQLNQQQVTDSRRQVINTGLVQERANQFIKRMQENYGVNNKDVNNRIRSLSAGYSEYSYMKETFTLGG